METVLINVGSVTAAQRGQTLLKKERIFSKIQKAQKSTAVGGCGWTLRVAKADETKALHLLEANGISIRAVE